MSSEKKWRAKEESLVAKQRRLNKKIENARARIQNILKSPIIPRALKITMISELKAKIKNYELEIGINEDNKELIPFDELEQVLQDKWMAAIDEEEERRIAEDLMELEAARDQMREDFVAERHEQYMENEDYRNKMRKIMGHKSVNQITMKEVKNPSASKTSSGYTKSSDTGYTRGGSSTSSPAGGTSSLGGTTGSGAGTSGATKPVEKKKFGSKDYWGNLADIAARNGMHCRKWEERRDEKQKEEDLQNAQNKFEETKNKVNEMNEKVTNLEKRVSDAEKNISAKEDKQKRANEGLGKLENAKKVNESKKEKARERLDKEKEEDKKAEIQNELKKIEDDLKSINKKIESARKGVEKAETEVQSARDAKKILEDALTNARNQKNEAVKEFELAKKELEKIMGIEPKVEGEPKKEETTKPEGEPKKEEATKPEGEPKKEEATMPEGEPKKEEPSIIEYTTGYIIDSIIPTSEDMSSSPYTFDMEEAINVIETYNITEEDISHGRDRVRDTGAGRDSQIEPDEIK